jgi:two-component system, OmpR family, phosphate regulon sensor histidine kinase PhoR
VAYSFVFSPVNTDKKMKPFNPYRLVIIGAMLVVSGNAFIYTILAHFYLNQFNWIVLAATSLLIFGFTYLIFRYILEDFIYEKIRLIYKSIHTLKRTKDNKAKNINLHEDIISRVNEDVSMWAEQRSQEIEELKKLETYRREFLANVSHELKTPIFNIQGFIHTLLDGAIEDPDVNRDYLGKTDKNIERMINIVKDLEIISQLETGEIKMIITRFDIIPLIREVFEMLEIKADKKGVTLCLYDRIKEDSEVFVKADKDRVRQVLHNLIENSINYGNTNGRTKVSFFNMDDLILVEVSDDGMGIEEKHLPRLFERFYRVDKGRSRNMGGSGLGLAIVKHIIESHQQTINVRSAPGVGTTFAFTLKKG